MDEEVYDPAERARAKEAGRQRDEEDLAAGRVDAAELQRRNAFIPSEKTRRAVILKWNEFE
jgi:hypothetical protein